MKIIGDVKLGYGLSSFGYGRHSSISHTRIPSGLVVDVLKRLVEIENLNLATFAIDLNVFNPDECGNFIFKQKTFSPSEQDVLEEIGLLSEYSLISHFQVRMLLPAFEGAIKKSNPINLFDDHDNTHIGDVKFKWLTIAEVTPSYHNNGIHVTNECYATLVNVSSTNIFKTNNAEKIIAGIDSIVKEVNEFNVYSVERQIYSSLEKCCGPDKSTLIFKTETSTFSSNREAAKEAIPHCNLDRSNAFNLDLVPIFNAFTFDEVSSLALRFKMEVSSEESGSKSTFCRLRFIGDNEDMVSNYRVELSTGQYY